MQKRSRRPHGIRTRKISVSISDADREIVVAFAEQQHRGNVSAAFHAMIETLRRQRALGELIAGFGGERATKAELDALRGEITAAAAPRRRRRAAA